MTLSSQEMIDQFWADPATGVWTSDELVAVARAGLELPDRRVWWARVPEMRAVKHRYTGETITDHRRLLGHHEVPTFSPTAVTIKVADVGIAGRAKDRETGRYYCSALDCWEVVSAAAAWYCQRHVLDELAREAQSLGLEY